MKTEINQRLYDCDKCIFKFLMCQYLSKKEFEETYKNSVQARFKKGEYILKQGIETNHMMYLAKGKVKFNYETETRQNIVLTIVTGPNLLGGANLLNNGGMNFFSIIAIEDCEVCLLDTEVLKTFILRNSHLSLKLLEFVSSMFKDSILNFISLAHKQVNGRLADVLLFLSKNVYQNKKFILNLSRKEIAEFAGCSEENVIHTFSKFHKERIIATQGKNIEILDIEKLLQISRVG
jgi:CRP/FNR family transcriptional regulator, polysaccharide utilization system transcription regulator